ncbi:hypothetical protein ELF90_11020, partial [Neisseria gonorrhoeae]
MGGALRLMSNKGCLRKNTMKVKIIYGKYFEQFDLDYEQDLDVLKKDIEFALSVIE